MGKDSDVKESRESQNATTGNFNELRKITVDEASKRYLSLSILNLIDKIEIYVKMKIPPMVFIIIVVTIFLLTRLL